MGYVKLICFCIWMIEKIGRIGQKQVTHKKSGQVLCGLTIMTMVVQIAGGILLTVYGGLIQSLSNRENAGMPSIWWAGIVPFVMGIGGIVFVYQRLRRRIVIWVVVNISLYFGNLVLLTMTDGLSYEKFGLDEPARSFCIGDKTMTTTTTTTMAPYFHVNGGSNRAVPYFNNYDNNGDPISGSSANCRVFEEMEYSLMPGLVISLCFYSGACLLTTVFASIIGCCLQECIHDADVDGPDFVPIPQTMDHGGSVMSLGQPQFVPTGYPGRQYPGHYPTQYPPTMAPLPGPGGYYPGQQYSQANPAYSQPDLRNHGQQPAPQNYGQQPVPQNYGQADPRYSQPDYRVEPSAPPPVSVTGHEYLVHSDRIQLM